MDMCIEELRLVWGGDKVRANTKIRIEVARISELNGRVVAELKDIF